MAKSKEASFKLNTLDDLFTTQEMRDEKKKPVIEEIPLNLIDSFPGHPYKVKDDEDMMLLAESIKEMGVLTPATVRKKGKRYELISGHRRKRACELAGLATLRAEVVDLTKDEATIFMVESNLQREKVLPSEKAFAYKMRLEAMKRQGHRTDLTSAPMGPKLRSNVMLAQSINESVSQIKRYIRLTELIPPILDMVDEEKMALRPAVEISYLPKDLQESLLDAMQMEDCTPSHAQTLKMRKFLDDGKLNAEVICSIMQEEKPNQQERFVLKSERIKALFPKNLPAEKREDYVVKAMQHYNRYRQKKAREMEQER